MDCEKLKFRMKRFGHDLFFSLFELAFWIVFGFVVCLLPLSFDFYRRTFESLLH